MKLSLLQISLIISLVGIFILISIANLSPPDSLKISEINSNQLNKNIIISGQITNIMDFEESNFQIITLKDSTGEIQATINKVINLNKNQNITIIGKITEYRGELQINTNKIINSFILISLCPFKSFSIKRAIVFPLFERYVVSSFHDTQR